MTAAITTLESLSINNRFARFVDDYFLKTAVDSRVFIIEGISGSGKDTLQAYLKKKLANRDVYDYSEGELLQSWNQLQIEGIFGLRVKFMKLFVNHIKNTLRREENAVFLLNRFHLSAYVMTIVARPQLEREYVEILNVLRTLPVHVFLLQLDRDQIEKRSLHPERSVAWQRFQQQIVKREGFRDRLDRYIWQQRLMLEAAEQQQIPYCAIKLTSGLETERPQEAQRFFLHSAPINAAVSKIPGRKRRVAQTAQSDN